MWILALLLSWLLLHRILIRRSFSIFKIACSCLVQLLIVLPNFLPDGLISTPLMTINPDIYQHILAPSSVDEWILVVTFMPNGKAAGLSGIPYKLLKRLESIFSFLLHLLVTHYLAEANIPNLWWQVLVYPIPKSHDWNCQLKNTYPITLLETIRKTLVKLIYNYLSAVLIKHSILKGGNFAGLPDSSCKEPIAILESINHDSVVEKKPLWVLFQDIFKAFDSVNLCMLEFTLAQLRFSLSLCQFLLFLFRSCTNKVITHHGLIPSYHVNIGIDQGEIISPLLWVIYLNPLLTALHLNHLDSYHMSATNLTFLAPLTMQSYEANINNLVFMNDFTLSSHLRLV